MTPSPGPTGQPLAGVRLLAADLAAMPLVARLWWALTITLAVLVLPWALTVEQPRLPVAVSLLVALINAVLVIVTVHRRRRDSLAPTFDYGGVATVTVLVLAGPTAALVSHLGEKLAAAAVPNSAGHRPALLRTLYNMAWGAPSAACAWAVCLLLPDPTWHPLAAGAVWWLVNGLLVGPMAALSQGRSWLDGVRLALTNDGWLRTQEVLLVLFAVLAWRAHPVLLGAVVLLVITQAVLGRRLFHQYETATIAREEAALERRRAEEEATRARRDPLTGLPNRHALREVFGSAPARPGLLMIDLDHFKHINDAHGHDAGDVVLVEVGQAIRHALRPGDFCARLGGEEFCAVLPDIASDDELAAIAERVRLAVRSVRPAGYGGLVVTASIGAYRLPHNVGLDEGLRFADQATYRAKADGRDRVELFSEEAAA
jgi:diguanylate cyclase (GGDEF)-like protein